MKRAGAGRGLACLLLCGLAIACGGSRGRDVSDSVVLLDRIDPGELVRFGADRDVRVFEFDDGAAGFNGSRDVADLGARDGRLVFRSTGPDPYVRVPLDVAAADVDEVEIEVRVERYATQPRLYFATDSEPATSEEKSIPFPLPRDSEEVVRGTVAVGDHPKWTGRIRELRLDLTDVASVRVEIDAVRLLSTRVERPRRTSLELANEWRRVRVAPAGDRFEVAARVHGPVELDFGIAVDPAARNEAGEGLRFRVERLGAGTRVLFDETLPLGSTDPRYRDRAVRLDGESERTVRLRFSVEAEGGDPSRLAGLWAEPLLLARTPPDESSPPSVVLVSIDTLRPDHLGAYGYERDTSPNLDRLAAGGVLFREAIAQAPETLGSHMSILTGRIPSVHGVTGDLDVLSPSCRTLADSFLDAGYRTAAFTEGGYVDGRFGFHRGFQRYHDGDPVPADPGGDARRTFERARAWLDRFGDRPFFLFVHTYEVHTPYAPPEPYHVFGDPAYDGPYAELVDIPQLLELNALPAAESREHREQAVALYDGEIRCTDHHLGGLLDHLERAGLDDRTVVVVLSDHGEEFDEHGAFGIHGHTLHDEVIRVPLIVHGPGIARGREVARPVALYDLLPTLAELLDLSVPEDLDGVSFAGSLAKEAGEGVRGSSSRGLVSEDHTGYTRFALRRGRSKYVATEEVAEWWVDFLIGEEGVARGLPPDAADRIVSALLEPVAEALYDLEEDPGEHEPGAPESELETWRKRVEALRARAAELAGRYGSREAGALRAEDRQRLSDLGYLDQSDRNLDFEALRARLRDFRAWNDARR